MEKLAPEERAAFLLREVFDVGYGEIARVLQRSETACRQVVTRARTRVRAEGARFRPSPAEIETLARRFTAALEADDYESMMELLTPDAEYVSDGGGKAWVARDKQRRQGGSWTARHCTQTESRRCYRRTVRQDQWRTRNSHVRRRGGDRGNRL